MNNIFTNGFYCAASPGGRWLAVCGHHAIGVRFFPIDKGRLLAPDQQMEISNANPTATADYANAFSAILPVLAWRPDGRALAVVAPGGGSIDLWDVTQRPPTRHAVGKHDRVGQLVWTPDGRRLASVGGTQLLMWDMTRAKPEAKALPLPKDYSPVKAAFEADGSGLCLTCWHAHKWPVYRLALDRPDAAAELVFPDGRLLATYHNEGWKFLDVETRRLVGAWGAGPHTADCGRWAEDGRHFLVTHFGAVYVLRLGPPRRE